MTTTEIFAKLKIEVNPRYEKWRKITLGTTAGLILLVLLYVSYVIVAMPGLADFDNPDSAEISTQVFSSDGQILGMYFKEEQRMYVPLSETPRFMQDALIVTEDVRFYSHSGVDLIGMTNAVLSLFSRGGSTITMQLARNLYDEKVGKSRSIERKIREMIVAVYLERRYTKREILELYLNTVPWGGTNYGVQAASNYYFRKNSKELEPHESALLVALLKGASAYNPQRYPKKATERRNHVVLALMREHNKITQKEYDKISKEPLDVKASGYRQAHAEGLAPYFREHLRQWLKDWCEKCEVKVNSGGEKRCPKYTDGLKVYTTIDSRLQRYAEEAVAHHLGAHQQVMNAQIRAYAPWKSDPSILQTAMRQSYRYRELVKDGKTEDEIKREFNKPIPMRVFAWKKVGETYKTSAKDTILSPWDSLKYYAPILRTGVVSIDQNNGNVLAWVGGVDYEFFKYDHVAQGARQVGSAFKPFVYATAFDNNYSPCRKEENSRFAIKQADGTEWAPHNADGTFGAGEALTLRQALGMSVNVVTARLIDQVGPGSVIQMARNMGVRSRLEAVPALSLGVCDLSAFELTNAYATFANQLGKWHEPIFVTRIEDAQGNLLQEFKTDSREALNEQTAYLMKDILRYVVTSGTGNPIHTTYGLPWNVYACGKTGTTQEHSDGWFMGFTPRLTTGVWVGCDSRKVHFNSYEGQGGRMALPIWAIYMKKAYGDRNLNFNPNQMYYPPAAGMKVETDCGSYDARVKSNATPQIYQDNSPAGDFDR